MTSMESFDEITREGKANMTTQLDGAPLSPDPVPEPNGQTSANTTKPHVTNTKDDANSALEELTRIKTQDTASEVMNDVPLYPKLTHEPLESPRSAAKDEHESDDEDHEIDVLRMTQALPRRVTPSPELVQRNRGAVVHSVGEEGIMRMQRFQLYETQSQYYIVGTDTLKRHYRILKISRTADAGELDITEDDIVYTAKETQQILNAIDEGNRATGGLKEKIHEFWGLLGFIRFTGPYYMVIVSKRSHVALLGGHYVFKIDKTEMIQLSTSATAKIRSERYMEEAKLLGIFSTTDLSKGFYFSRSYDITRCLQHNIIQERKAINEDLGVLTEPDHNDMFIWNHHLLGPAKKTLKRAFDWCIAITHGYIDQSNLSVYWGREIYITIIARRSRRFAGARYLKRGANDLGYVANDVETEQIVAEMQNGSFHAPGPVLFANSKYTSYVQHRGSIPLYWTQDSSGVQPKPDIHLSVVDPFYTTAALHFDNLFERYGTPIYVLNLIKQKERAPRESKLGPEYKMAIDYLNQFLQDDDRILYKAFDQARATKSKEGDVIGDLEEIAADVLSKTKFFHNGISAETGAQLQNGVARTNCIDCIDRTNAAQFMIGKKALGFQLHVLGLLETPHLEFDTDANDAFTNMWHDHGDTIAIQYGGSHLVNTMSTYRKQNGWQSHSRDMVESLKRFYNNSFLDAQRQESYNLLLGNYTYKNDRPMLWDLSTDYYLHHTEPRSMFGRARPSYRDWYTPAHLEGKPELPQPFSRQLQNEPLAYFDDYWSEYYRPLTLSSFRKVFAYRMHSNLKAAHLAGMTQSGKYDLSPFKVRIPSQGASGEKSTTTRKKGVKVIAPAEEYPGISAEASIDARLAATNPSTDQKPKPQELGRWLDLQQHHHTLRRKYTGIIKDSSWEKASHTPQIPAMPPTNSVFLGSPLPPSKAEQQLLAFEKLVADSLHPIVAESDEYRSYLEHASKVPLVTTGDSEHAKAPKEFVEYISRNQDVNDMMYENAVNEMANPYADAPYPYMTVEERAEASKEEYEEYVACGSRDNALTVLPEDDTSKRYKKYKSWTKGKSLFKQKQLIAGEFV